VLKLSAARWIRVAAFRPIPDRTFFFARIPTVKDNRHVPIRGIVEKRPFRRIAGRAKGPFGSHLLCLNRSILLFVIFWLLITAESVHPGVLPADVCGAGRAIGRSPASAGGRPRLPVVEFILPRTTSILAHTRPGRAGILPAYRGLGLG
jgi:hypothetical protein